MQSDDELIQRVCARARNPRTRTDFAKRAYYDTLPIHEIPPPVAAKEIASAEARLGFPLPDFYRRLLQEVGNGGFGPGNGLIGLPGGYSLQGNWSAGQSVIEIHEWIARRDESDPVTPGFIALCDWGCATYACMDALSADALVLTAEEEGLTQTQYNLRTWFQAWTDGTDIWGTLFAREAVGTLDPSMKEPFVRERRVPTGAPYERRRLHS